jgi:hypothetical protein
MSFSFDFSKLEEVINTNIQFQNKQNKMSNNSTIPIPADSLSHSIKFVVLLAIQIPSSIASSISLIYIVLTPAFRSKEHNRSICVLLVINFIQLMSDLPMTINFFRTGGIVQPASSAYCLCWIWFEFTLNGISIDLMTWISIERHLLIFHSNSIRAMRPWQRWCFLVAPLIICLLWIPIFLLIAVIVSPTCKNVWDFTSLLCGLPCYLMTDLGTFDLIVDTIIPVAIILIANIALVARVIIQQSLGLHRNRVDWHRQRKMVIQLGIFSTLYLSIWLPLCIVQLGEALVSPTFLFYMSDTVNFLAYVVPLLLPFACLIAKPEIIRKCKAVLFQRTRVAVMTSTTN